MANKKDDGIQRYPQHDSPQRNKHLMLCNIRKISQQKNCNFNFSALLNERKGEEAHVFNATPLFDTALLII